MKEKNPWWNSHKNGQINLLLESLYKGDIIAESSSYSIDVNSELILGDYMEPNIHHQQIEPTVTPGGQTHAERWL